MKKKIRVTKEDIWAGEVLKPDNCIVARALKRDTGADKVSVGTVDFYLRMPGESYGRDLPLPVKVTRFIRRSLVPLPRLFLRPFLRPFEFTIDLPAPERRK